jgi:hypothetical protein
MIVDANERYLRNSGCFKIQRYIDKIKNNLTGFKEISFDNARA